MNSSGRGLQFIEDFVVTEVMPAVTDAAAMATVTGLQTNMFLDQAKYVCTLYTYVFTYKMFLFLAQPINPV